MASRIFGVYQMEYIDDRGTTRTLRSKTAFPPDSSLANAQTIAGDLGITLVKYGDTIVNQDLANPICSDSDSIKPRRIELIRSNGNSISFAMPVRENMVADAEDLVTVVNAFTGDFDVVCVKLYGERATLLFDELGGNYQGDSVLPPRGNGSRQYTWHGTLNYRTDATFGSTRLLPFKVFSDNENAAPTWGGGVLDNCMEVGTGNACSGRDPRTSRRYIITAMGTNVGEFKSEIPVTSAVAADIRTCGATLAARPGVYCLDYRGEFNDRFHKILPSFQP